MIQDLFASRNVQINTPAMLKVKSQLDAPDVVKDRRIASKRIHVKRIIGLAKTYAFLKKVLKSLCRAKQYWVQKLLYPHFLKNAQ